MPKRLTKDDSTATETYAKIVSEPFETGYGHTIGNSLQHRLLSSLEGAAISSIKVYGAMHEFFTVDGARVGQRTDYDRLVLEVWTDGRISPDDALTQASAILQHHLDVFVGYDKNAVEFEEVVDKQDEEKTKLKKLLNMSVNEIELSVRAANCLNNANITSVGQLAMKSEQEMLKYRNFGKKSLNEIKEKLAALGLSLGMTFEPDLLEAPKEEPTTITR